MWKEAVNVLLHKKGDKIEYYKGISLLNSAYKIFAWLLKKGKINNRAIINNYRTSLRKKIRISAENVATVN